MHTSKIYSQVGAGRKYSILEKSNVNQIRLLFLFPTQLVITTLSMNLKTIFISTKLVSSRRPNSDQIYETSSDQIIVANCPIPQKKRNETI